MLLLSLTFKQLRFSWILLVGVLLVWLFIVILHCPCLIFSLHNYYYSFICEVMTANWKRVDFMWIVPPKEDTPNLFRYVGFAPAFGSSRRLWWVHSNVSCKVPAPPRRTHLSYRRISLSPWSRPGSLGKASFLELQSNIAHFRLQRNWTSCSLL